MIVQTIKVSDCTPQTIVIGRRGTYDTVQIAFDLSYLVESYGNGVAVLAVKRSQDSSAYPAVTSQEDDLLLWTVSETDTFYVGAGEAQLMWYVDGGLAKTIIYPMVVMKDILTTSEEAPDAYQEWVDTLIAEGAETLQNAQDAAQSASDAEQAKDDAVTAKEAAEAALEEFTTPTASATTLSAGSQATATYSDGNFAFGIPRGADGSPGAPGTPGADGVTPDFSIGTVTTLEPTQPATATITGTTENPVLNLGIPKGAKGDPGQGGGSVNSVNGQTGDVVLDAGDLAFSSSGTYDEGTVGAELSDAKNAISEGNLNQHIKVNPFVIGNNTTIGTAVKNRSKLDVQEDGSLKVTNATDNTLSTYGSYFRIETDNSIDLTGHKLYIKLSGLDFSGVTHFTSLRIYGALNGTVSGISTQTIITDTAVTEFEQIYTATENMNQFGILLYTGSTENVGEYFSIGYVQLIDLTAMFGAGYEPSLNTIQSVYGSSLPYPFRLPTIISDLNDVIALIASTSDCDIVQTSADIAATIKDYVLVLRNDSDYGNGGRCLFHKGLSTTLGGHLRDDGSKVFPVPDQGKLIGSSAPIDEIMPIIRSYVDNSALVYGQGPHGLFGDDTTNEIDCSEFVCAVLQGISYDQSKYVTDNNYCTNRITSETFNKTTVPVRLVTYYLSQYFAEQGRLYSFDNGIRACRDLQFGDILFISDDTMSGADNRYLHIRHCAFVLAVNPESGLIWVAEAGGSGSLVESASGETVCAVDALNLSRSSNSRYISAFARPIYCHPQFASDYQIVNAIHSGNYEITMDGRYVPGMSLDQDATGFSAIIRSSQGLSMDYYDVLPNSTVAYTGPLKDDSDKNYFAGVFAYDSNFDTLSRITFTGNTPEQLPSDTRYVRFLFGYGASQNKKVSLHTGDAFVATITAPDSLRDEVSDLSNTIDMLESDIDTKASVIINSASGDIATFADGADGMPIKSLVASFKAVQASGTPTPENPLPITGYTGLNVYRESSYDTEANPTVTVNWEDTAGTVYSGSLNVISGILTATHKYIEFDGVTVGKKWTTKSTATNSYYVNFADGSTYETEPNNFVPKNRLIADGTMVTNMPVEASNSPVIPRFFAYVTAANYFSPRVMYGNDVENLTDANAKLAEWYNNGKPFGLLYKLAVPVEYQLTPQEVTTILGNNAIWTDVGPVTVEYPADTGLVVSQQKNAISQKADKTVATTTAAGLMSASDKTKLDDVYADYSSALIALGVI